MLESLADGDLAVIVPALETGSGPEDGEVRRILAQELADRRLRDRAFAPLAPLVRRPSRSPVALPPSALARLWRGLKQEDAEAFEADAWELSDTSDPAQAAAAADRMVARAAAGLDAGDPETEGLRQLLAVCPLARATLPRMRNYMRTAGEEHAAALRLAYRDAAALDEDAPPRLLDVLAGHLDQPWHTLRLVCAVMDRPRDRYLAASELGRFGEAVLDDVDRRVHQIRAFTGDAGVAAASAAAEAACGAVQALAEFDRCIALEPSSPWTKRIVAQRRNLARAVESRLRQAVPALARALPEGSDRARGRPNLELAGDARARGQAEALLVFTVGVRAGADAGGFAVTRAQVVEALDRRLSTQADHLVQLAHDNPGAPADAARDRLAFVAGLLGRLRDSRAAETVRRRAAAA